MLTPPTITRLAALHDHDRYAQAAQAHRITRALAPAPDRRGQIQVQVAAQCVIAPLWAALQTLVSLLFERRGQAGLSLTLALMARLLLRPDGVAAGRRVGRHSIVGSPR